VSSAGNERRQPGFYSESPRAPPALVGFLSPIAEQRTSGSVAPAAGHLVEPEPLLPGAPPPAGGAGAVGQQDSFEPRLRLGSQGCAGPVHRPCRGRPGCLCQMPAADRAGNALGSRSRPRSVVLSRRLPQKVQPCRGRLEWRRGDEHSPGSCCRAGARAFMVAGVVLAGPAGHVR
jgi:hypothetical protein